jgi:cobalt-zinc-cadmium efflux system protein
LSADHNLQTREAERRLWLTLSVAVGIAAMELVGGLIAQSLSLIGDSGHVFTDVLAIGLSIFSIRLARRPHSARWSYGYHRAEIFAALANGGALIGVALLILYTAYLRFFQPVQVQGSLVLLLASIGLAGNLVMALVLNHGRNRMSLNVRGALLHVMGDALSSVGVIVGGLIVIFTGYVSADSVVAALIGILIIGSAYALVRDSVNILGEATPRHLELEKVAKTVEEVKGVRGIHDLHVWTISSGLYALSGHLIVDTDDLEVGSAIIREVSRRLRETFGIEHVTLQLEKQVLQDIERPSGQLP